MMDSRILVVEDDHDIAHLLELTFANEGYRVAVASNGRDALDMTRSQIPDLIILDIMLPGMDGYEVCSRLRETTRTSHIPIIFLTQKGELDDKIAGLELGADDYVTKPFNLPELILRVKNAIATHKRMNLTDPRTGLPASRLIEEQLRKLIGEVGWHYLEIKIEHLSIFADAYSYLASDEVLRSTALILNAVVNEFGKLEDFVAHADANTFILITYSSDIEMLVTSLENRFYDSVKAHYNFQDVDRGGILLADGAVAPIMSLSTTVISWDEQMFTDIRELTQVAARKRGKTSKIS